MQGVESGWAIAHCGTKHTNFSWIWYQNFLTWASLASADLEWTKTVILPYQSQKHLCGSSFEYITLCIFEHWQMNLWSLDVWFVRKKNSESLETNHCIVSSNGQKFSNYGALVHLSSVIQKLIHNSFDVGELTVPTLSACRLTEFFESEFVILWFWDSLSLTSAYSKLTYWVAYSTISRPFCAKPLVFSTRQMT